MNLRAFYIDKKIDYREYLCEDEIIQKFYLLRNEDHVPFVTIPDGCVDIQFLFEGQKKDACISGSLETPHISHHINKDWIFGVKLNPGIVPMMVCGDEIGILDRHIDISGQREIACILERLQHMPEVSDMITLVRGTVENMIADRMSPVASDAMQEILNQEGCVKMAQIADTMKYSQHYINREFKKNTGFSLKQYAEIIRLQSAITYLEKARTDLVYEQLGYYDQAHFIKDFKKYTLLTPQNYIRRSLQGMFV